jgi:hypothetical protein
MHAIRPAEGALCAGAVKLECEEGCTCKPREYSLQHWNHVSLVYWKPLLNVELWNGTQACVIRVTNPVRNSTERKLKVSNPVVLHSTGLSCEAPVLCQAFLS